MYWSHCCRVRLDLKCSQPGGKKILFFQRQRNCIELVPLAWLWSVCVFASSGGPCILRVGQAFRLATELTSYIRIRDSIYWCSSPYSVELSSFSRDDLHFRDLRFQDPVSDRVLIRPCSTRSRPPSGTSRSVGRRQLHVDIIAVFYYLVAGGWLWRRLARLGSSFLELFPKGADLVHGGHVCLHHDLPLLPVVLESGQVASQRGNLRPEIRFK